MPPERVPPLLPELRAISDVWLREKHTREKGFSLGYFDEAYLSRFPVAVARQHGAVMAFANIWTSNTKTELSIDLMRHLPSAPGGVMQYLFTELLLWGKTQGYEHCSLGMAPLSGLDRRELAPLWSKVGAFLYRHGEHFIATASTFTTFRGCANTRRSSIPSGSRAIWHRPGDWRCRACWRTWRRSSMGGCGESCPSDLAPPR